MKERIVIVFIAVVLGLLATTAAFFIYQSTKVVTDKESSKKIAQTVSPTSSPSDKLMLIVEDPKDESVLDKRTIQVRGKTNVGNTILISSNQEEEVAKPTTDGKFAITITIDAGVNNIITRAIAPNGDEITDERVVVFSTEEF